MANNTTELLDWFRKQVAEADPDFMRGLVSRGLSGVKLVVCDAHEGLKDAIASCLPGASWQRCRTHFMRNLLYRVPKSAQSLVATLVRSIFAQPDKNKDEIEEEVMEALPAAG